MVEGRRRRPATEEKVARVLDAAEEVMLRDGYAAVTSRNVAAHIGIQAPLVHYYFPTVDDLFVAVLRRRSERNVERMAAALASERPLQAWWELVSDPRGTALLFELVAAANHWPPLKAQVGAIARDIRAVQVSALRGLLPEYGLDPAAYPPVLVATAVQGVALAVVSDEVAGYDTDPAAARAAMDRLIDTLEARRARG